MFKFKKNIDFILFSLVTSILILCFLKCKGFEYKQCTNDLQCLLKEAGETQKRLITSLNILKSKYNNAVVIDPGIKKMPTIKQLLQMRYNNDASKITDYARATIGVENLYQVYNCLEDIKTLNLEVVSVKDNFFQPYPEKYRDINIIFKDTANNHLGEIQINILNMLQFSKHEGYELFDKRRKIKFQAYQEHRDLSSEENKEFEKLLEQEIDGNNKTFGESMKIDNKSLRVGIHGILIHNKEVLMVREQSGSKLIYNFPGGGVENNEGLAEALMRECKEEILADVLVKDRLYISKNLYVHEDFANNYTFNLYYVIEVDKDLVKNGTWFPINKLPLNEMLPIDKEFAEFLQKILA